jgi:LuxR family maltose regulon positive regulatory protein
MAALASLTQAEAWFAQMHIADPKALAWLQAHRARLWLQQGDLDAATQWATSCVLSADIELHCEQQLSLVRLYLAQYRCTADSMLLEQASTVLAEVYAVAERTGWPFYHLEARILQTLTQYAQHDGPGALAALHQVLSLAQPGGYLRIFLDEGEAMRLLLADLRSQIAEPGLRAYVERVLAAFPHDVKASSPASLADVVSSSSPDTGAHSGVVSPSLVEPLTERELELLRLVSDGLSNSEIAATLIVTVGTVKKHLNNIFGKLGVGSRTQAIARARDFQLL